MADNTKKLDEQGKRIKEVETAIGVQTGIGLSVRTALLQNKTPKDIGFSCIDGLPKNAASQAGIAIVHLVDEESIINESDAASCIRKSCQRRRIGSVMLIGYGNDIKWIVGKP